MRRLKIENKLADTGGIDLQLVINLIELMLRHKNIIITQW